VVQAALEAHLRRAVRDRLDLLFVHGVHVLHVECPTEINDFDQNIVACPRHEHYVVGLEVGVHDPETLKTGQALLRKHHEHGQPTLTANIILYIIYQIKTKFEGDILKR